jgi:hypothetical protein
MPDTDRHNIRAPKGRWKAAADKCVEMRRAGYDIDVTLVMNHALVDFANESIDDTVTRLSLTKGDQPAQIRRQPRMREISRQPEAEGASSGTR